MHQRTPGAEPHWATEETMFLIEDELPIWSRDFSDDDERFFVQLQTEDRMTVDGFHAEPDRIEVDAPSTPALTPAEAMRLARDIIAAANASTGETPTSNAI